MSIFGREQFEADENEAGIHMSGLGRALVIWAAMNYSRTPLTVADAALAFNTTPEIVREAIEEGMWISWEGPIDDPTKQMIELDGE